MVQISEAIVCFVYCASVYKDEFSQMFFYFLPIIYMFIFNQCSAEKFRNWGQCPRALEKVGTFEKKSGDIVGKMMGQ